MDPKKPKLLRTLNACQVCDRQYDVSHLSPGDKVRCECGVRFRAEFKKPHTPRHLRCSNCGGNVAADARACSYCKAEITLEEKSLSSICPRCWARMSDQAKFCMECGIGIQPQLLLALREDRGCPRCKAALRTRELVGIQVVECGACGGLWLSQDHFESLCDTAESQEMAARELRERAQTVPIDQAQELRYVPCVACGELMHRRNYAHMSGVVIDVCRRHGAWLDHGELEKILAFVRSGGLDRARVRDIERLRAERQRVHDPISTSLPVEGALGRGSRWSSGDVLFDWLLSTVSRIWR